MTEEIPKNAKFKIGDYVRYENRTWKIDGFGKINGVAAYDISVPNDKGFYIKLVLVTTGNEYFSKA